MNVTLTPNQTLGRMLYEFSATAYEVAENNIANLRECGILGTNRVGASEVVYQSSSYIPDTSSGGQQIIGIVPITQGGTNATTVKGARDNLNIYSKQEILELIQNVYTKEEINNFLRELTVDAYTKDEMDGIMERLIIKVVLSKDNWVESNGQYTYTYSNTNLKCGNDGTVSPMVACVSNMDDYANFISASGERGVGIVFTSSAQPANDIEINIIDPY